MDYAEAKPLLLQRNIVLGLLLALAAAAWAAPVWQSAGAPLSLQ